MDFFCSDSFPLHHTPILGEILCAHIWQFFQYLGMENLPYFQVSIIVPFSQPFECLIQPSYATQNFIYLLEDFGVGIHIDDFTCNDTFCNIYWMQPSTYMIEISSLEQCSDTKLM